jgi:hypothetical protein
MEPRIELSRKRAPRSPCQERSTNDSEAKSIDTEHCLATSDAEVPLHLLRGVPVLAQLFIAFYYSTRLVLPGGRREYREAIKISARRAVAIGTGGGTTGDL